VTEGRQEVVIADIHMPFGSMVSFMVKWTLASIPAMVILFMVGVFFWMILMGLGASA
jgi:hypothetical protein